MSNEPRKTFVDRPNQVRCLAILTNLAGILQHQRSSEFAAHAMEFMLWFVLSLDTCLFIFIIRVSIRKHRASYLSYPTRDLHYTRKVQTRFFCLIGERLSSLVSGDVLDLRQADGGYEAPCVWPLVKLICSILGPERNIYIYIGLADINCIRPVCNIVPAFWFPIRYLPRLSAKRSSVLGYMRIESCSTVSTVFKVSVILPSKYRKSETYVPYRQISHSNNIPKYESL